MLIMTDESRAFLEENCPAVLQADNLSDALDILYDDLFLSSKKRSAL